MRRFSLALMFVLLCALLFATVLPATVLPAFAQEDEPTTPRLGRLQEFLQIIQAEQRAALLNSPAVNDEIALYASLPQSRASDGAFVLGDPDAPITLVEFTDWACPHCQDYRPVIETFIGEEVASGRARFEVRMFPTAGGQQSLVAGLLAECAEQQQPGAFWSAHAVLYALGTTRAYQGNIVPDLTARLQLDQPTLEACASTVRQVLDDIDAGETSGVDGTPTLRVRAADGSLQPVTWDGQTYQSGVPIDVLRAIVAAAHEGEAATGTGEATAEATNAAIEVTPEATDAP